MWFRKKLPDEQAMEAFWAWFSENEMWIRETIKTDGMQVVLAVDSHLVPVFPYWKKDLEFLMGFNDGVGEFSFYHLGNRYLQRDGQLLGEKMPENLRKNWKFILEN